MDASALPFKAVSRLRSVDSAESRRRTVVLAVAGVALLVVAGLATARLVGQATTDSAPSRSELCVQMDALVAATNDSGIFATQALNRAARRTSDLAAAYRQPAERQGQPPVSQAAEDIRTVTASVAWEVSDLVAATRPLALECGWTWPVSVTPPAPAPTPPTSTPAS